MTVLHGGCWIIPCLYQWNDMVDLVANMNESAMPAFVVLLLAFFTAAAFYAAVGHGGASAYLLVLAMWGVTWTQAKPIALGLNVLVSLLATVAWWKHVSFPWRMFLPLVAGSMPAAYAGNFYR